MNRVFLIALISISFAMLSMDSPKLSKRKIYEGVSILMPQDFVVMSDRDISDRYPSTKKPLASFISSDTRADFTMNNTKAKFNSQTAEMLHEIYKVTIIETYDTVAFNKKKLKVDLKFLEDGVKKVGKKEYAYFEFVSEFNNIKKYNYIMYTPHKKHILIFNFSCDQRVMDLYRPIANKMMNSVKVSSKLTMPDYFLQQNNNVPRKRQSAQDLLEMQNKNKSKINNANKK
jgi:hypothetical protein